MTEDLDHIRLRLDALETGVFTLSRAQQRILDVLDRLLDRRWSRLEVERLDIVDAEGFLAGVLRAHEGRGQLLLAGEGGRSLVFELRPAADESDAAA